jgi:VanZ family protein
MTWRWWCWLGGMLVWTLLLLAPLEAAGISFEEAPQWQFTITTLAHVVGYAALTTMAGWLKSTPPVRLWLLYALAAHAVLSELMQPFFERTGCLEDAAFDLLGVLLGLLVARGYWFAK